MARTIATDSQIEDDPGILLTVPNNTKIERLQEELDSANRQNKYLKNITPLIITKNVEDVTKIKVLQDQLDMAIVQLQRLGAVPWSNYNDISGARMWQFTDSLVIGDQTFDGNEYYE